MAATKRILVIGAGTLGKRAVERLHKANPTAAITVVDHAISVLEPIGDWLAKYVCQDGISFLVNQLKEGPMPDWIVPAIPRHVAYEWMIKTLKPSVSVEPIPVPVFKQLPNPIRGKIGEVYTSNADFICPDDCPEPKTVCTVTGKPRPRILHSYLAGIRYENYRSVVVVSRQLAPGVGGYRPKALRKALSLVKASHTPVLLSTACKCHGVVHAFKIRLQKITLLSRARRWSE